MDSNNRVAKLIFVEGNSNKNKFYNMTLSGDVLTCEYGRVDSTKQTVTYAAREWDKKYSEKMKKGYEDVTHLFKTIVADSQNQNSLTKISDSEVEKMISKLMSYANTQISANYNVSSKSVTQLQIDQAQSLINSIAGMIGGSVSELNSKLESLFKVIPRKMKKVSDYLIPTDNSASGRSSEEEAKRIIQEEQILLDTMAAKVSMDLTGNNTNSNSDETLLDTIGISMTVVTSAEEKMLKDLLGDCKNKYSKAFAVTSEKTTKAFNGKLDNKALLFHGSRNENIISIMKTGLLIRPASAVYTGSMFGDGIYFANKARKSLGYTSLKNSYWTKGNSDCGYMIVFEVALGNQKHIHKHTSACSRLSKKSLSSEGYDSVFAHKGADLLNDELVIYDGSQCNIKYLIELN